MITKRTITEKIDPICPICGESAPQISCSDINKGVECKYTLCMACMVEYATPEQINVNAKASAALRELVELSQDMGLYGPQQTDVELSDL